jgi:hypothetical protein
MTAAERVECDGCGKKVRLHADGTVADHSWRYHSVEHHCDRSGTAYTRHARHMGTFRIVTRDPIVWLCECRCGESFLGPEYEAVEGPWKQHSSESVAVSS